MRLSIVILLLATTASVSSANQSYHGFCEQGAKTVVTNGVSGAPRVQGSYPQCTVTVYVAGTLTPATIYSDNSNTPKANPFTANTFGYFFFYAANGHYDVTLANGGLPAPWTIGDVLLADPASGSTSVTSFNGRTGAVLPAANDYSWLQLSGKPLVFAADYAYSQTPGGTISIGANTVTLTPCPFGVAGAYTSLYVYLSGGSGSPTAEAVAITGGTCTSGATTGTLTFTATVARTGSWTASSASGGIGEAWQAIASTGGSIIVPSGTTILRQTVTAAGPNVTLTGLNRDAAVLQAASGGAFHALISTSFSNTTISDLTIDGNFINTAATYQYGIFANSVSNLIVRNTHVKNVAYATAPAYVNFGYSNSGGIFCNGCTNASIHHNWFTSNWCQDINGFGDGAAITDNKHGVPTFSLVNTNVAPWDTMSGGVSSVSWFHSNDVTIAREQIWGNNRFYTPSFQEGNPILADKLVRAKITDNQITGMTPLPGTCSVTNGSATVTCTLGVWTTDPQFPDPGAAVECETGVGLIYKVLTVNSATTITLNSVYAGSTLSTARCRAQIAGDGLQTNGLQYSEVRGNSVAYTGMGIDINMSWDGTPADNVSALHNVVAENIVFNNMACGINLAEGTVLYSDFIGNHLTSNHQGSNNNNGATGGFCLVPTPNNVLYYTQAYLTFTGNTCIDTGGTQKYCVDVDTGAKIAGSFAFLTFNGNTWTGSTAFSNLPITDQGNNYLATPSGPGVVSGPLFARTEDSLNNTAGAQTYTAAQMVGSPAILRRDPGAPATDVTPTATLLMTQIGLNQSILGTGWDFYLRNVTGGANTITLSAGTGVTLSGTLTVLQNQQRWFHCYVTNASTPAVQCYSMGTATF